MPAIRVCKNCGRKNRIPAEHLADTGRCGACKTVLPPVNEPIEADVSLFDEITGKAKVPVLVDFWAAWCGPCRVAGPEVTRAAAEMLGKAIVLKVDTEQHPDLAARFNVRGIPNFAVFAGGKLVQQQAGVARYDQLKAWIEAAAPVAAASMAS